jgi:hypothetical protein
MSLNEDFEIVFSSGTTARLFIDPAELVSMFPEAAPIEIFDFVRMYSLEMQEMFQFKPDDAIPLDVQEYVRAATACALTRLGVGGMANEQSVQLGDLQVSTSRGRATQPITRLTASTWCELAGALREELTRSQMGAGIRAVVKGSNFPNPMPSRRIRRKDHMPTSISEGNAPDVTVWDGLVWDERTRR